MRHTQREAETQAEGKAGALGETNVGLDPRTLGSRPEPNSDAQPLIQRADHRWNLAFLNLNLFPLHCNYIVSEETNSQLLTG